MNTNTNHRILIVDDDSEIRQLLKQYLSEAGYTVEGVANGVEMHNWLRRKTASLIILDVMLPGDDGLTLCSEIQSSTRTPVILLTALGSPIDRVVGLEMGADDYLPKPFEIRELLARIKVVLRRVHSFPTLYEPDTANYIRFDGWELDTRARHLKSPAEIFFSLAGSDYLVLRLLLKHAGHVLSRDFLIEKVFEKEPDALSRAIDICVSRLRQAIEVDSRSPKVIRTIRNRGYMLTADVIEEH